VDSPNNFTKAILSGFSIEIRRGFFIFLKCVLDILSLKPYPFVYRSLPHPAQRGKKMPHPTAVG
jgi:hypothetical protein